MTHSNELRARCHARGVSVLALLTVVGASGPTFAQSWPSAGADLNNSHHQAAETLISASTVGNLGLKWTFQAQGDVTAIPAVVGGYVYFPDAAGNVYKVNASTGQVIWSQQVPALTGIPGDYSRTTPAITGNTLIIGTQTGKLYNSNPQGGPTNTQGRVIALDTGTGKQLWQTVVDSTPQSMVTTSAAIAPIGSKQVAIVGVASNEELTAAFYPPLLWQWQFRGSVVALDVASGGIIWRSYVVPQGYYGGSIWGSTPAIDAAKNRVYVSTGDNYMTPQAVLTCLSLGGGSSCVAPNNYADSIVALALNNGNIVWGSRAQKVDVWSVACGLAVPPFFYLLPGQAPPGFPTYGIYGNCPDPSGNANPRVVGPDYDFGQGPMLFGNGLVGAGAKSGIFWAFNAKDGSRAWSTQVSPGGVTGGMQWGSATDGSTIYVSASNAGPSLNGGGAGAQPWQQYQGGQPVAGATPSVGGWASVNATTGAINWTTPVPDPYQLPALYGFRVEGPVTLANGVAFGCDMTGTYTALAANTGAVLWSMPLAQASNGASNGNACTAGAAIVNGMVFWGSGDGRNNQGAAKMLFAFGF